MMRGIAVATIDVSIANSIMLTMRPTVTMTSWRRGRSMRGPSSLTIESYRLGRHAPRDDLGYLVGPLRPRLESLDLLTA